MPRTVLLGMSFLLVMFLSTACENMGEDLDDHFGNELLEERATSILATYQAENRTGVSGCQVATNHVGFTGSGFIDFGGNGTWIEWNNVEAPFTGEYLLTFRYAVGTSNRQSSLIVNGQNVGTVGFANTGSWTTWKTDPLEVPLRQGKNTIRLMAKTGSGGPNLDKMDLAMEDQCPSDPEKMAPGECGCGVPEGTCDDVDRVLYKETFDAQGGNFKCSRSTCSWTSKSIDVTGSTKLLISADTNCYTIGQFESADYIRFSYSIDGGSFVPYFENRDDLKTKTVSTLISNSGRTLRIKIDAKTSFKNETYEVDNLTVMGNGGITDRCPDDPSKIEPGECGCGVPEGSCGECTNILLSHEKLLGGEHICSENGKYEFGLTSQGKLAIWTDAETLWSAGTFGSTVHLVMQGDGNLVVYNAIKPLWDSKTHGNPGATLKLENDGRVVNRLGTRVLWSVGGDGNDSDFFTIGFMPDTQYLVNDNGSCKRDGLRDMFDYFVDRESELELELVAHLGDLTQGESEEIKDKTDGEEWDADPADWVRFMNGYNDFRDSGIPFAPCRGNHDQRDYYERYFPVSDYRGEPFFGGYKNQIYNAYYLISAAGQDFIVLAIDYFRDYPDWVIDWANGVLQDHRDRTAIIISHSHLKILSSIVKRNDNVYMAIMGHSSRDVHWTQKSSSGRTQHIFVFDYQNYGEHNCDGAIIKYFTFYPDNNVVKMRTHSVRENKDLTGSDCYDNSGTKGYKCQKRDFPFEM